MATQKPTLIITGVSGLIGSAVARHFADRYHIVGFDIKNGGPLPDDAQFIHVDLTSEESVEKGLEQVRSRHGNTIASVIHLAAYYDFSGEPSPLYHEITVQGTDRLLRGLLSFEVEQLVFSSTMLVYAPCEPGQRIDENWPLEPKWDYPKSKVATEDVLINRHEKIPIVLLRIAGIYDEGCHSIPIAHQIQRIYERRMTGHVYPGDLERGQAFLHLEDLLSALDRVVERRGQLPDKTILLLGEPDTLPYGEMQDELGQLIHGKEWKTMHIPKPVAKAGAWVQEQLPGEDPFIKAWMVDLADDHYALDISRAESLLDWHPTHRLRGVLPEMVLKLKSDPLAWYRENHLNPPKEIEQEAASTAAR